MSLCISVVTPEGIVVAGESRQTQVIAGVNRIGSDSAVKVFDLTNTVLAATAGWAFLQPQGAAMMRNISSIIEEFKPTIPAGSGVRAIATQKVYELNIWLGHTGQAEKDPLQSAHLSFAGRQINQYLDSPDKFKPQPASLPPDGPPIGSVFGTVDDDEPNFPGIS